MRYPEGLDWNRIFDPREIRSEGRTSGRTTRLLVRDVLMRLDGSTIFFRCSTMRSAEYHLRSFLEICDHLNLTYDASKAKMTVTLYETEVIFISQELIVKKRRRGDLRAMDHWVVYD